MASVAQIETAFKLAGLIGGRPDSNERNLNELNPPGFFRLVEIFDAQVIDRLLANVGEDPESTITSDIIGFEYFFAAQILEFLDAANLSVDGRRLDVTDTSSPDFEATYTDNNEYRRVIRRQIQSLKDQGIRLGGDFTSFIRGGGQTGGGGTGGGSTFVPTQSNIYPVVRDILIPGDNTTLDEDDTDGTIAVNAEGGGSGSTFVPTQSNIYPVVRDILIPGDNTTLDEDDTDGTIAVNAEGGGTSIGSTSDVEAILQTNDSGETIGTRLIRFFRTTYGLALPVATLSSDEQVLKGRAGDAYWEVANEVPDTPGDASAIGHVLTVSGENDQDYRWQELPDTTRSFGNLRFFPFLITRAPSPPAGTEIFTITDPIIASSRTQTPATLGPELIGLEFTVRAADNIITLPQQFIPTGVREVQSVPLRKRYAIQLDSNTSATLGASDLYFDYELVTIDPAKPNEKRIGISYKTTVGNLALQRINRILGARGPQGFTGPTSTTPGPRGPIGPQSTIPGPRGPQGPIFRPTIENLYIPITEIFKAGDQIVLAKNAGKQTITINATPPEGSTGNFVFTTLSPASGSPTTQQTFNVTADQNIFSILLTTSNAGAGSGTYPRFWIRRSELLSSNKRYVSDTHNPTATDDNSSLLLTRIYFLFF